MGGTSVEICCANQTLKETPVTILPRQALPTYGTYLPPLTASLPKTAHPGAQASSPPRSQRLVGAAAGLRDVQQLLRAAVELHRQAPLLRRTPNATRTDAADRWPQARPGGGGGSKKRRRKAGASVWSGLAPGVVNWCRCCVGLGS